MRQRANPAGWVICLVALTLCGCSYTHRAVPRAPDPARLPPFRVAGVVRLVNVQTPADVVLSIPGVDVTMNYYDYTESAIKLLRSELDRRRASVSRDERKELRLSIVDVRVIPSSPEMRCLMNFSVETGDGYIRGHETTGASWNFQTAINAALSNVVIVVLNDERVIAYLER